jgi:hypothetical protein
MARSAVPARMRPAAASQLRGGLQAKGPRLTRRDVVVDVRRGSMALVEDVLDIEPCLPGLGDLRVDAGVYIAQPSRSDADDPMLMLLRG